VHSNDTYKKQWHNVPHVPNRERRTSFRHNDIRCSVCSSSDGHGRRIRRPR
jgi:hypothetical protein